MEKLNVLKEVILLAKQNDITFEYQSKHKSYHLISKKNNIIINNDITPKLIVFKIIKILKEKNIKIPKFNDRDFNIIFWNNLIDSI